jgi:hypothetical protein
LPPQSGFVKRRNEIVTFEATGQRAAIRRAVTSDRSSRRFFALTRDAVSEDGAMTDDAAVTLSRGLGETTLPALPREWTEALADALTRSAAERVEAVSAVARAYPRLIEAWASLAELSDDDVQSYAYARVGYHRGLDALRAAGWRGSGYVRWRHEANRGVLRSVEALSRAAGAIGETDEEERCALLLHQLDPEWARRSHVSVLDPG